MSETNNNRKSKKNLFTLDKYIFILTCILAVLSLAFIVLNVADFNGPNGSGLAQVKSLAGIYKTIYYVSLVVWILLLALFAYTSSIRIKKSRNIKTLDNALLVIGLVSWLITLIASNVVVKFLTAATNMLGGGGNGFNFSGFLQSGAEVDRLVAKMTSGRSVAIFIFTIIALVSLVISAIMYYKKLYKRQAPKPIDKDIDKAVNKMKDSGQGMKKKMNETKDKIGDTIKEAKNYDDFEDYETEDYDETVKRPLIDTDDYEDYDFDESYNSEPKEINKKFFIIPGLIILVIILGFAGKMIYQSMKPDAVISTQNMDVGIYFDGYEGYGTAYGEILEFPKIVEVKNEDDRFEIQDIIYNLEVTLDKTEGLKNGDEVTATVSLPESTNYKIKFDKDSYKKTSKVEGLETLINSIQDINEEALGRMDKLAKKVIKNYFSYKSDLKVEKIRVYEEKIPETEIKNNIHDSAYSLTNVYAISYYDEWYSEYQNDIFAYKFYNIKSSNGGIIFDYSRSYNGIELDELDNRLKFDGYTELQELRGKGLTAAKTEENKEAAKEEAPPQEVELTEMEKLANSLVGQTKYIKERGNLRNKASLSSDVIVQLPDDAEVEIKKAKAEGNARVWCYVRAYDLDGSTYDGWVSHKVLK
ncbi:SH3 domain-containing protein [uncultured Peptoniphilus sp.]|uniref:SH3 domain-containing protein n=1 Tax=uncultured Peptoniphilus sp. TaxID=254354 RepID=UPI0025F5E5CA|nr:SH3 domain-containing protein [uncultured Peptoniphilus sp.]